MVCICWMYWSAVMAPLLKSAQAFARAVDCEAGAAWSHDSWNDGAGRVRQFFSITIPQLRNTFVTSTILMVVGTFTSFDIILLLTQGGPAGGTTNLPYYMYDAGITSLNYGYGSAIATLLIVIATGVSVAMVKLTGYDKMSSVQEGI